MQAGKLRHRIKIFDQSQTRTASGAVRTEWEHILTLWADITPLSVKDVLNAQAANSEIRARAKMRYRTDINSKMRLEHMGRTYEIDGDPLLDAESGKEYMTLMLKSAS